MRAYKQLFFDNNDELFDKEKREIIDNGIGHLLNTLIRQGYAIKRITLQRHQSVFLLIKNIDSTEYTVEIKYGGQITSLSRFVQISTEHNNPEWSNIVKLASIIFLKEEKKE